MVSEGSLPCHFAPRLGPVEHHGGSKQLIDQCTKLILLNLIFIANELMEIYVKLSNKFPIGFIDIIL